MSLVKDFVIVMSTAVVAIFAASLLVYYDKPPTPSKSFYEITRDDDVEGFKRWLGPFASEWSQIDLRSKCLHPFVRKKCYKCLEYLLTLNVRIDQACWTQFGRPALFLAVELSDLRCVKLLANKGADVNFIDMSDGDGVWRYPYQVPITPLHLSIVKRNIPIVLELLQRGANIFIASPQQICPCNSLVIAVAYHQYVLNNEFASEIFDILLREQFLGVVSALFTLYLPIHCLIWISELIPHMTNHRKFTAREKESLIRSVYKSIDKIKN